MTTALKGTPEQQQNAADAWRRARDAGFNGSTRLAEIDDYARQDDLFAVWLYLVDRRIIRAYGIGLLDLSDWMARDAFDAGVSPKDAARDAIAADDTFALLGAIGRGE